ncbi:MAG: hypothetical protein ACI8TQ_003064, partial [Planctomycetota bacterium]
GGRERAQGLRPPSFELAAPIEVRRPVEVEARRRDDCISNIGIPL